MFTDTHCHPYDLSGSFPQAEEERKRLGVIAAASACNMNEFAFNEDLAHNAAMEGAAPLLLCFAIHPQIFAHCSLPETQSMNLEALDKIAAEGRIAAVGECGFDLYNTQFRETEAIQEQVFAEQLEIALRYDLPVILHVRRAMHKIFSFAKKLSRCKAIVFHSWSGTLEEGHALLARKVNVYFSFGNVILNGHKQAMRCCAQFPAERLLTETDAPYQPARGRSFSSWTDLPHIIEAAAALRSENSKELETQIEENFKNIFTGISRRDAADCKKTHAETQRCD